jgi:hypothetical protein
MNNSFDSILRSLGFASIAASIAALTTHPLDTVKVKIQIEGNSKLSTVSVCRNVLTNEGVYGFFNGVEAALLRSLTYGSLRYAFYNPIKSLLNQNSTDPKALTTKILSGSLSGCIASAICNPTDLIKVRMQAPNRSKEYYTIFSSIKTIYNENGIIGFWRGVGPTSTRATIVAASELGTYDHFKESLLHSGYFQDNMITHFIASISAGFISAVVSNPFDFAKSRIMNQKTLQYKNTIHCMIKSVHEEGFMVLWSGFWSTFARLGPNIVITFMVLEQLQLAYDKWVKKEGISDDDKD